MNTTALSAINLVVGAVVGAGGTALAFHLKGWSRHYWTRRQEIQLRRDVSLETRLGYVQRADGILRQITLDASTVSSDPYRFSNPIVQSAEARGRQDELNEMLADLSAYPADREAVARVAILHGKFYFPHGSGLDANTFQHERIAAHAALDARSKALSQELRLPNS